MAQSGLYALGVAEAANWSLARKKGFLEAEFGLAKLYRQELSGSERSYTNERDDKTMYSQRVFQHLAGHRLMLEFDLGGSIFAAPVLYLGVGFFNKCSQMRSDLARGGSFHHGNVCVASQSATANELLGMESRGQNPMAVPLTKEQASSATQIKANWVLARPDGTVFRKNAMVLGST